VAAVGQDASLEEGGALGAMDVRLRREISHRRSAVALARRFVRITALHTLDAALLGAALWLLAAAWPAASEARPYIPAIVVIFLLSLNALSTYGPGDARRDHSRLLGASMVGSLIIGCLALFPPNLPFTIEFIGVFGTLAFVSTSLGRKSADLAMRQVYVRGFGLRRAIVVGSLHEVGQAIHRLRDDHSIDQYLLGHLTPEHQPDPASMGTLARLPEVLDNLNVQEVVIATILPPDALRIVTETCFNRGVGVYVIPSVVSTAHARAEPVVRGPCALLRLHPARLEFPALLMKRMFDIVMSVLLLVLTAPLMALIALAIRLDSPGPVFFRQERVGVGGRRFMIWKFRSMFVDAEHQKQQIAHLNAYADPRLFKLPEDPRITRVGRFLRRSSLDELPQLFNVLAGEMSLVGPRPPLPSEVACYEPHHYARLAVVPGITGPWQVGGRNLITDFETVVHMERSYIESWSLLLDAKILLRTLHVVLRGKGAY
jgi:exopolysaccharide biosynthesis polyprenyl glycosylphosphotransferase